MNDVEFRHFFGKARDAVRGGRDAWSSMSTGEKVAVALVLNKADWLAAVGYTMAEAIERAGSWVALMPWVVRELEREQQDAGEI
ncbi:hypothetical protein FFI97_005760 [Variovorax sp. KBS0712]|uniref:hypothetical protein n=1 Tax=Variovorax sp. KBS0712 TaxID=2578111 RepID=UPI00111AAA7C|nr:hypothetical protein [Variovorax sp. KBS0712]TSD59051.1 hypothetical protein FFI97_001595 [Variovorax sp. KBS0712]TSD59814.1 hypothetical protein FFI97_005760 [Variovorax sp. KBS0712]